MVSLIINNSVAFIKSFRYHAIVSSDDLWKYLDATRYKRRQPAATRSPKDLLLRKYQAIDWWLDNSIINTQLYHITQLYDRYDCNAPEDPEIVFDLITNSRFADRLPNELVDHLLVIANNELSADLLKSMLSKINLGD